MRQHWNRTIAAAALMTALSVSAHARPAAFDGAEVERCMETGRFERARSAIETIPDAGTKAYWRGKLHFYAGDYPAAYEALGAVPPEGEQGEKAAGLRRYFGALASFTGGFREFESEHFRFRVGGIDAILAPYALEALERTYREIGADLGYHPPDQVLVEVHPGKEEFSAASTLPLDVIEKSGTVGICKFNRLMILSPQALPLGYTWLDTLAHEYVHLVVNRLSAGRCPLWLHEGIARYHDTRWRKAEPEYLGRDGESRVAVALKTKSLIPFARMHPSLVYLDSQDEISLAFAQVSLAVRFLRERFGAGTLARLLAAMTDAEPEAAFRRVTGLPLKKFEKQWQEFTAGLSLREAPGALSELAQFSRKDEEEFIGADQRGQVRLGDRLRQINRPQAALVHYEKARAAEPANPVILLKIARARLALGEEEQALAALREAAATNPHYVTPYQTLAELHFQNQEHEQAAESCRRALAINPFHPGTHAILARCCLVLGLREEALRELSAAAALDPSDAETRVILERLTATSP